MIVRKHLELNDHYEFILWLKSVPTWRLTKNALLQLGFVMIVRKHLELNDHYEFILCKFIKLNLFAINVPKTLVQITKSFFVIYKERILPRKRKKTVCTSVQSVPEVSITRRTWNDTWPNTRKEHSRRETINRKRNLSAISAEKSMEITNLGSITSRATASSTNAKLVLVVSKPLVVSSITWLYILVLLHSIVASVEKLSSLATNLFFIKNLGIQTSDRMRANGVAKAFCSRTNLRNIGEGSILAKNHSSATCAISDSPIQVLYHIIASVTLV